MLASFAPPRYTPQHAKLSWRVQSRVSPYGDPAEVEAALLVEQDDTEHRLGAD
jgi:hypothetical protein